MNERFYAGVGSRETPEDILAQMTALAMILRSRGYTLRSGGARGADTAFARGAECDAVIYLPWIGFPIECRGARTVVCGDDPRLREVARQLHPNWRACGRGARALHTRNVAQILGSHVDDAPSEFVVCWTPGAMGGGGTGGALRIAASRGIQVYDLALPWTYDVVKSLFAPRACEGRDEIQDMAKKVETEDGYGNEDKRRSGVEAHTTTGGTRWPITNEDDPKPGGPDA